MSKDITRYARVASRLVRKAWPEIVNVLIAKAKSGGYNEIKLLLELCDLAGADARQTNEERQRQLCDALMDGLGLRPAAEASQVNGASTSASKDHSSDVPV